MKKANFYWIAFLFFIITYLVPLAPRPMISPDEFRYAQVPREMIESGNWSAPHLLHMRYFEKPVLGYWMTAASFKVFGENKFALRFPMALMAGATAFMIALLVHQTIGDEHIAAMASMLFMTSGLVYGVGTFAVLDLPVTALITGISCSAFQAMREPRTTKRRIFLLILCGIFAGLAFMTKGFLAFAVPGLTILGFIFWERRWKELYKLPWIPLVVMLAVVLPWAIRVHQLEPDFWHYFVMEEHWNRFTGGAESEHPAPFWYFIPVLIAGVFPGALLWLPACCTLGKQRFAAITGTSLARFCICATVLPFLFFSASSGKLATYILPCFPFLAILAAMGIASYFRTGGSYRVFHTTMSFWGGLLALGGVLWMVFCFQDLAVLELKPDDLLTLELLQKNGLPVGIAAMICGIVLFVIRKNWRYRMYAFFAGIAVLINAALWSTPEGLLADKTPEKALKELFAEDGIDTEEAIIITLQRYMHAVAWCSNRSNLLIYGRPGELDYGNEAAEKNGEPGNLLDDDRFMELINRENRPDILLVHRSQDKRFDLLFDIRGDELHHNNFMTLHRLKPGAKIVSRQILTAE